MKIESLQPSTMTLVLTPRIVLEFGRGLRQGEATDDVWDTVSDIYKDVLKRDFGATVRSKSVSEYQARWGRSVQRYSRSYDDVLRHFMSALGPSYFRVAYVKAITDVQADFQRLTIAMHDLVELYRRHVAYSMNIATNHESIVRNVAPETLDEANNLLRSSNFGVTLLFLLLAGDLSGPSWILLSAHKQVHEELSRIAALFKFPLQADKLVGSLKIRTGDLSFLNDTSKR